jgi:hypothetical protein
LCGGGKKKGAGRPTRNPGPATILAAERTKPRGRLRGIQADP